MGSLVAEVDSEVLLQLNRLLNLSVEFGSEVEVWVLVGESVLGSESFGCSDQQIGSMVDYLTAVL